MLTISSVSKSYGSLTALSDVSLDIASGEFLGLLGPNGAGKSTLMSLISGLKRPDAGSITLNDISTTNGDHQARHELGLVPQNIALYDELTAEENLQVFGELFWVGSQDPARADHRGVVRRGAGRSPQGSD